MSWRQISLAAMCCAFVLGTPLHSVEAATKALKILYTFKGGNDGAVPGTGVINDAQGNFYGTTVYGGGNGCGGLGCGTIFKLAADGTETVLYVFQGDNDGMSPSALVRDGKGNLYGTTQKGGSVSCDCGTVFELSPAGAKTVLHVFEGGTDGGYPEAALLRGKKGNLYG